MTAPALIKQADLRRMAEIAKSQGVRVEMEIDGKIFRVSPDIHDNHSNTAVDADLAFGGNSLSEWRARHEGKAGGRSSGKKATR